MSGIDWSYWANLDVVDYRDACILSRGFDPRATAGNAPPAELEAALRHRVAIAKSHLGGGLHSYATDPDRYYGSGTSGVRLAEFRAWGESLPAPFTFPDEFPRLAAAPAAPVASESAQDKPLSVKRENTLLRVIVALAGAAKIDIAEGKDGASLIAAAVRDAKLDGPDERAIRSILKKAREF